MSLIHTFELSGLGKAPFRYVANPGKESNEKAGIFFCEHCGTMLKNRHFIRSADGLLSVVGIDCLNKSGDSGLIDAQKAEARNAKEAERARSHQEQVTSRRAKFEEAYGISPDALAQQNEAEIHALTEAFLDQFEASQAYAALLKSGNFGNAMIEQAKRLEPFSANMLRTIKEITTKHVSGARKNSKAYLAQYPAIEFEVDAIASRLSNTTDQVADLKNDLTVKWQRL